MAVITTEELFKKYFEAEEAKGKNIRHPKSQLDRPELYAYEQKIGKQFVDFDADDILGMIATFKNKKNKNAYLEDGPKVSANSYKRYISGYKQIFLFYVRNYELVRSPYDDPKLKGINVHVHLAENRDRLTWEKVEYILNGLYTKYEHERASFYELIIRLFYDGFAESQEIINVKESDINFRRREISVPGRTIRLSERTVQLLLENRQTVRMESHRTKMDMVSWNGSYIKFFVHPSKISSLGELDIRAIGRKITIPISSTIPKDFGIQLNYRKLYLLGFYDFAVRHSGEDRVREMVLPNRNHEASEEFERLMAAYPVNVENASLFKQSLVEFCDTRD